MSYSYKGSKWDEFRKKIIERDGDECTNCNRGFTEGAILQVHHKKYIKGKKYPWDYPLDYCTTLCKGCHAADHGIKPPLIDWEFLSHEDTEELSSECEYCGTDIRHIFYIKHDKWRVLGVGTICCDNLTGNTKASEVRKGIRNTTNFVNSPRWEVSKGVHRIKQKGINISIVNVKNVFGVIMDNVKGEKSFLSVGEAKRHVFQIMRNGVYQEYIDTCGDK